jgi:hypothetical protein
LVLLAAAALAAPARAEQSGRLTACFVSLNDPDETAAFKSALDPRRFAFVDIRAAAPSPQPAAGRSWLADACTPQTSCDLLVLSGEFAGRFFGKDGPSLSLQEMEEASCQARCAGFFHRPREVFLLACNTLATKNEDSRSPQDYLRVLLEHGFDRAAAERVVEIRYGPLGPSFRESLRRIFAGVPRIYGFSSVAPRGESSAAMLSRYFRSEGNYAEVLRRRGSDTGRNGALFAAFKGTALSQVTGLTLEESGGIERRHICALYDESRPLAERLRTAYGLLLRQDALTFVPTLEVLLSRHPPESLAPIEASILAEIQSLDAARREVMQLVGSLDVSALKLELAHFAVMVGWLHRAEFHAIAVDGAARLLHEPLTSEVVDVMCEITKHEPLGADFGVEDVPPLVYRDAEGLRLLSCLAPADPRIAPRVVPALASADPALREWAAHTLTRLLPRDVGVLEQLVPYLRDQSPAVSVRIRWLFHVVPVGPPELERSIRAIDPALYRYRSERYARVAKADGNGAR